MPLIGIIDYGAGNLMSVMNALDFLGFDNEIISEPKRIESADAIILPGVGAFPAAVQCLEASGFMEVLKDQAARKPFLGICVGMQMLLDIGHEFRPCPGLGLIEGEVRKIETSLKLPHIGWNGLEILKDCPILRGIDSGDYVYFVHSFAGHVKNPDTLAAVSGYGAKVTAVVQRGHIFGTQFHPEKSGEVGLQILRNFCELY